MPQVELASQSPQRHVQPQCRVKIRHHEVRDAFMLSCEATSQVGIASPALSREAVSRAGIVRVESQCHMLNGQREVPDAALSHVAVSTGGLVKLAMNTR